MNPLNGSESATVDRRHPTDRHRDPNLKSIGVDTRVGHVACGVVAAYGGSQPTAAFADESDILECHPPRIGMMATGFANVPCGKIFDTALAVVGCGQVEPGLNATA